MSLEAKKVEQNLDEVSEENLLSAEGIWLLLRCFQTIF
jgi:hypothetical protein